MADGLRNRRKDRRPQCSRSLLTPEQLNDLDRRLQQPPEDDGLWNGPKKVGQRPMAEVDPGYERPYLYGFVHPATGKTEWLILPRVNSAWFNQACPTSGRWA